MMLVVFLTGTFVNKDCALKKTNWKSLLNNSGDIDLILLTASKQI